MDDPVGNWDGPSKQDSRVEGQTADVPVVGEELRVDLKGGRREGGGREGGREGERERGRGGEGGGEDGQTHRGGQFVEQS